MFREVEEGELGGFSSLGIGVRFGFRELGRASLRIGEEGLEASGAGEEGSSLGIWVRFREGKTGKGVASLRLSGGETSGYWKDDSSTDSRLNELARKVKGKRGGRGRLLGGSGGLDLVSAETACCGIWGRFRAA